MRYSTDSTPVPRMSTPNTVTVAGDLSHPTAPNVPVTWKLTTGPVVSIATAAEAGGVSTLPAQSDARALPSVVPDVVTVNGVVSRLKGLPLTLYSIDARPRPPSLSTDESDTVTGDLYQPGIPGVPDSAMVVVGAVVSGGVVPGKILATNASSDPAKAGGTALRVAQSVESVPPVMNIVPMA